MKQCCALYASLCSHCIIHVVCSYEIQRCTVIIHTDIYKSLYIIRVYIYTLKFLDVQRNDLIELLISFSDKTGMDILGFDRRLVRIAGEHIVDSLLCIINDSLSNGTFPDIYDSSIAQMVRAFGMNPNVGGSPSGQDIFCLKNCPTFTRTFVGVSKINFAARAQLTFQLSTLHIYIYIL